MRRQGQCNTRTMSSGSGTISWDAAARRYSATAWTCGEMMGFLVLCLLGDKCRHRHSLQERFVAAIGTGKAPSAGRLAGLLACLSPSLTLCHHSKGQRGIRGICLASIWRDPVAEILAFFFGMQISQIPMCNCPRRHHPSRALQFSSLDSCHAPLHAPELELLDSTRIFAERPSLEWDQTSEGRVACFTRAIDGH